MATQKKSGAEAPVLRYNADGCRRPIPTDRVVVKFDTPAGRLVWLEATSRLLGECKRLVELFDSVTTTDSKVSAVDTLQRVKE
jgi:hypothetical protein